MPIQIYSFFSGVGFLDLGFQNAGFNIEFVNEINEKYLRAYQYTRRNNEHTPFYGYNNSDVRTFLSDEIWNQTFPDYDRRNTTLVGFIGGPPCPDFSVAGKNEGATGINGQLTTAFINLILKRKPDFFVFENVKGLVQTHKHRDYYNRIKNKLYRFGYSLFDSIENCLEYGVPQNRERLILIGFKRKTFGKNLKYEFGKFRMYDLNDIHNIHWPTKDQYIENVTREMPKSIIEELTIQHWFIQNDVEHHPNGNDFFGVKKVNRYNSIQEGDSSGKSFKRLHRWRYSPTAAYGNNEVHLHPYLPRRISVAEALAIQSLPAEFSLPYDIPLSAKFKMIGNGVPYLLALGIANELYEWIENFQHRIGE